jgi:hypothetical protein
VECLTPLPKWRALTAVSCTPCAPLLQGRRRFRQVHAGPAGQVGPDGRQVPAAGQAVLRWGVWQGWGRGGSRWARAGVRQAARCLLPVGGRSRCRPRPPRARPALPDMGACASQGTPLCPLASCFPCYCGGLAAAEGAAAGNGEWLGAAKAECAPYIDAFDVRSTSVRVGISLLVVLINNGEKAGLRVPGKGATPLLPALRCASDGPQSFGGRPLPARTRPRCAAAQRLPGPQPPLPAPTSPARPPSTSADAAAAVARQLREAPDGERQGARLRGRRVCVPAAQLGAGAAAGQRPGVRRQQRDQPGTEQQQPERPLVRARRRGRQGSSKKGSADSTTQQQVVWHGATPPTAVSLLLTTLPTPGFRTSSWRAPTRTSRRDGTRTSASPSSAWPRCRWL